MTVIIGRPAIWRHCDKVNFRSEVHVKHQLSLTWTSLVLYMTLLKKERKKDIILLDRLIRRESWNTGFDSWEVIGHVVWLRSGSSLGTVTTDTDANHHSFIVGLGSSQGFYRSWRDVTGLIFPSAEHQQGFTVVSWGVTLENDGKHKNNRSSR